MVHGIPDTGSACLGALPAALTCAGPPVPTCVLGLEMAGLWHPGPQTLHEQPPVSRLPAAKLSGPLGLRLACACIAHTGATLLGSPVGANGQEHAMRSMQV